MMTLDGAIRASNLATVSALLRDGADVNCRNANGFTPLLVAAGLGQAQAVELLLTAGADVLAAEPRMGAMAVHLAAQSGNADVMTLLLRHGAFIDQQSPVLGNTPLIDAVLYKHAEIVGLLLERGARTAIRNYWHQTALDLAQADGLDNLAQLIRVRDEADAVRAGSQRLLAAVKSADNHQVEHLLAEEVSLNERAPLVGGLDDDYTALGLAVREGQAGLVRQLLEAGADPRGTIGLMRGTPLHEAAYFGNANLVRLLLENPGPAGKPELDAQGPYNGLTPLHDAVWHGHEEAARVLVAAGASLDIRSHAGQTPREMAERYGYATLAQFLAEAEQQHT